MTITFKITSHDNERVRDAILKEFERLGIFHIKESTCAGKGVFTVHHGGGWREHSPACVVSDGGKIPEVSLTDLMQMEPEPDSEDELIEVDVPFGSETYSRRSWRRKMYALECQAERIREALGEP